MLVLTIREGERTSIKSGETVIYVTPSRIGRGQLRLAFDMPDHVVVEREGFAKKTTNPPRNP